MNILKTIDSFMGNNFEIIALILTIILLALVLYNFKVTKEVIEATEKKYYNLGYIDGVKRMNKEVTKQIKELSK
jgi:hypothetical protein